MYGRVHSVSKIIKRDVPMFHVLTGEQKVPTQMKLMWRFQTTLAADLMIFALKK